MCVPVCTLNVAIRVDITLINGSLVNVEAWLNCSAWVDPGATALDARDGNVTANITRQ